MEIIQIPIGRLHRHPKNVRKNYEGIEELAESLQTQGIRQNLTVVPDPDIEGDYLVVIGNRRLLAARKAGLQDLPCVIAEMDEEAQIETMLAENMQRRDLNFAEEARAVQLCMEDYGWSTKMTAEICGTSETWVKDRRRILNRAKDVNEITDAAMKGATIADYMKVTELKEEKHRGQAMDAIGTEDFPIIIAGLIGAEREAEKKRQEAEWEKSLMADLEAAGAKRSYYESSYVGKAVYTSTSPEERPVFRQGYEYSYNLASNYPEPGRKLTVWTKEPKAIKEDGGKSGEEGEEGDKEEEEYRKQQEARRDEAEKERRKKLDELSVAILAAHEEFLKDDYREHMEPERVLYWIARACMEWAVDEEKLLKFCATSWDDLEEEGYNIEEWVAEQAEGSRNTYFYEQMVFSALAYNGKFPTLDWRYRFKEKDRQAQAYYDFLRELGWEKTNIEKQLLAGTHELYKEVE